MQSPSTDRISPGFLAALQEFLPADSSVLTLEAFIECALYHPREGYYTAHRKRVGRDDDTDFYTAASLGEVFAQLVVAAVRSLSPIPASELTFVELGPESEKGILGCVDEHPFQSIQLLRASDPIALPENAVVFSNEVFDARPFRRFIYEGANWREVAVAVQDQCVSLTTVDPLGSLPELPHTAPEGYLVDWPSGAHALMEEICRNPWKGLFIAFDYGLDRATVLSQRPQGTGRTYKGHTMGTNLLEEPGQRDLTCHLIWDEMQSILQQSGFQSPRLERQEAFFMHHAKEAIETFFLQSKPGFSRKKQTLMELLHPDNMGHKFQVLHAWRGDP